MKCQSVGVLCSLLGKFLGGGVVEAVFHWFTFPEVNVGLEPERSFLSSSNCARRVLLSSSMRDLRQLSFGVGLNGGG